MQKQLIIFFNKVQCVWNGHSIYIYTMYDSATNYSWPIMYTVLVNQIKITSLTYPPLLIICYDISVKRSKWEMWYYLVWFRFMVFNTTFNNISVISCQSVLLVEETGVPGENHWSVASHWQSLSHNVLSSTPRHEWGLNS